MVVSVRSARFSLKYCLMPVFSYSSASVEQKLHPIGSAQIQILSDHGFEELPTSKRSIEDIGTAELHLPDGEFVYVAGGAVLGIHIPGDSTDPFVEHRFDLRGSKGGAYFLKPHGICT